MLSRPGLAGRATIVFAGIMFATAGWYWFSEQASNVFVSSATGDPLVLFPGLGFVFLVVSVPLLLQGWPRYKLPAPSLREIMIVIPIGIIIGVLTAWLPNGAFFTPAAVWWYNYGFPLTWRVQLMRGCPPWCSLPSREMIFDPVSFVADCIFFVALGYTTVLARKLIRRVYFQ